MAKGNNQWVQNLECMEIALDFPLEILPQFLNLASSVGLVLSCRSMIPAVNVPVRYRRRASQNIVKVAQAIPLF